MLFNMQAKVCVNSFCPFLSYPGVQKSNALNYIHNSFCGKYYDHIMTAGKIGERSKITKIFHEAYLYKNCFLLQPG
jgi:hypothetical protein